MLRFTKIKILSLCSVILINQKINYMFNDMQAIILKITILAAIILISIGLKLKL